MEGLGLGGRGGGGGVGVQAFARKPRITRWLDSLRWFPLLSFVRSVFLSFFLTFFLLFFCCFFFIVFSSLLLCATLGPSVVFHFCSMSSPLFSGHNSLYSAGSGSLTHTCTTGLFVCLLVCLLAYLLVCLLVREINLHHTPIPILASGERKRNILYVFASQRKMRSGRVNTVQGECVIPQTKKVKIPYYLSRETSKGKAHTHKIQARLRCNVRTKN